MKKVKINGEILKWARESLNYSQEDLSERLKKDVSVIKSWEEGQDFPTYAQLEKISYSILKRPIAVFFLKSIPEEEQVKKSFRTVPQDEIELFSPQLIKIYRKAQVMQLKLKELFVNRQVESIHRLLSFKSNTNLNTFSSKVRVFLDISLEEQKSWKDIDTALKNWRSAIENNGIFVFKEAFRDDNISGFCLYDEDFPIIYINNSMPKSRQIFTLFHELAHLLFKIGGIDKLDDEYINRLSTSEKNIEIKCNQFASAFLVPQSDFLETIKGFNNTESGIENIAKTYGVSREVVLRKLFNLSYVQKETYEEKSKDWFNQYKSHRENKKGSTGDYYATQFAYLGKKYVSSAFSAYYEHRINKVQLADFLDVRVNNIAGIELFLQKGS